MVVPYGTRLRRQGATRWPGTLVEEFQAATRSVAEVDRAAKKELITSLHGVLKNTGVIVVAHNTGMVAAQSADFRKRVKEAGG